MRNGFHSSNVKQISKNQKDRESLPGPFFVLERELTQV
jgi:hypothetical protein